MGMRAALIANCDDADAGFIGRALRKRGFGFVEFLREYHEKWPGVDGIDLVVAMGSGWSTYWDHVAAPVQAEQALLRAAIAAEIPVLGVCFGAQQLSTVLGGEVTKAQSPEIGWHTINTVSETAHMTPSFLCEGPWMQWHYDRFSVPSGATVLAESPVGPQVIVCGRSMGVQFHPEASESIVRKWASGEGSAELTAYGTTTSALLTETSSRVEEAERRCDLLVEWFLTNIAQKHIDIGLS